MIVQTILLTRFNLTVDLDYTWNLDHDYLEKRFDLFEKYCLPSVKNQTSKDFKWLIYFDEKTDEKFKRRAERWKEEFSNIELLFLPPLIPCIFPPTIEKYLDESENILTVRCDNDDAIEASYIENLQKRASDIKNIGKGVILDVPCGLQYFLKTQSIYKLHVPYFHFIALLTTRANFSTVLDYDHTKIKAVFPASTINTSKPMWCEIVNGTNIVNDFRLGFRPRPISKIEGDFGTNINNNFSFWNSLVYYFLYCFRNIKEKIF